MQNPKRPNFDVILRFLCYLTKDLGQGLLFKNNALLNIEGYYNTDWVGRLDDSSSTIGYCVFIEGNLVSWKSKKQNGVARSGADAEYREMAHNICELI